MFISNKSVGQFLTQKNSLTTSSQSLSSLMSGRGRSLILGFFGLFVIATLLSLLISTPAKAVPSFSRQTGEPCTACHVGAFGPQLTPHGIKFKIGGYTDSEGKDFKIPLSGMLAGGYTHTAKAQDAPPGPGTKTNNNLTLDEASLFVAGRASDHLGGFMQITYDGIGQTTSLDQTDLRAVFPTTIAGKDTIFGISINNNPGVQDPFNSMPVWGFPYTESGVGLGSGDASTMINGGLGGTVLGITGYGFWNEMLYGEIGTYRSLSRWTQRNLGLDVAGDPGSLSGNTLYWRLAFFRDLHKQSFSVGLFGLNTSLQPDRQSGGPTNSYNDIGIDGTYQFLGTREHIATVSGSWIHESQTRDALIAAGGADNLKGSFNENKLAVSYYYNHTYGATLARFSSGGSRDATLYSGFGNNGSPGSAGYILQADWTPFGKENSWKSPWANLRLGLQYTWYTRFNGARNNYDGAGRNAKDNNTIFLFAWTSI